MVERIPEDEVAWVLYDGRCGLCDAAVRWLAARDRRFALRFAPLEGRVAAAVRARHPGLPPADETLVLVERPGTAAELVRVRSRAAIAIALRLGGGWRVFGALRVVPSALLDPFYRFVARRRGRWFGRLAECRVPAPAERARFLEVPVVPGVPAVSAVPAAGAGAGPSANMPPA